MTEDYYEEVLLLREKVGKYETLLVSYDDEVDRLVVQYLKNQYSNLSYDLYRRNNGQEEFGVFLEDKEKDIVEIQRHLEAIATVLSYNMVHKEWLEWLEMNPMVKETER
jgi:hypothetical protein